MDKIGCGFYYIVHEIITCKVSRKSPNVRSAFTSACSERYSIVLFSYCSILESMSGLVCIIHYSKSLFCLYLFYVMYIYVVVLLPPCTDVLRNAVGRHVYLSIISS